MTLCKICTRSDNDGPKRYRNISCNACVTFFRRSVNSYKWFVCKENGQCLKEASLAGISCRKCRFEKCLNVGITLSSFQASESTDTNLEAPKSAARTIDSLLATSVKFPNLLELYLKDENRALLNISLEIVKCAPETERIEYLTLLFEKYSINSVELPILCFICICKFEFSWLPANERQKIKELQNAAIKKVETENIDGNRLSELLTLSTHCLNIFDALLTF
uniref:Nuclear receptor domain-containing protein n=1 Tax=Panagrolaimus sp. ES5 TaxID=591445 RepID=A0AC34FXN2_9BILA